MAAIASSDLTVTVTEITRIGKKKMVRGTVAFGDGALTYSTAGIPLPAITSFGFIRQMDTLNLFGINARTTDYMTKYNKSAHKVQLFEEEGTAAGGPLLECDTSEAPPARTYDFVATGW